MTADWRLRGQMKYLAGAHLTLRPYAPASPRNDHDHCEFCWAKFMAADVPGTLHEGYATYDRARWICPTCFHDFKAQFRWTT